MKGVEKRQRVTDQEVCGIYFFFFKQKTAYEIYQCDWSSDVCSSDLEMYPSEEDLGAMFADSEAQAVFVPAGQIAENAGHIQAVNMVMLGSLIAQSGIVETDSVVLTIRENLDRGEDINVEAFWKGYEFITGKDYN